MGIEDMIKRENFYKILQETLIDYYSRVRQMDIQCSYTPFYGGEELRMFYFGSMVCRARKPKGVWGFLNAELNIRKNFWKYIAGKMMILYMMMTESKYSPGCIFLTRDVLGQNEIISPQNRSVRFYNFDTSIVDCIIKKGFTDKYFNNQIEFRKSYKYDFMVPMIAYGEGWFREPILVGHPLVRVTGKTKYQKGINAAVKDIQLLAHDTLEYIPAQQYIPTLLERTKSLTERARLDKNIISYNNCVALLEFIEKGLESITLEIPTCISHGDLQTGNIWRKKNGDILIYDWETAGRRSVWYDSTTLLYSLRRVNGWETFYKTPSPSQSLACDPNKNRNSKEFDFIKRIVLLEDYLFLIEDMMELPENWGREIFDGNINRIYKVVFENQK